MPICYAVIPDHHRKTEEYCVELVSRTYETERISFHNVGTLDKSWCSGNDGKYTQDPSRCVMQDLFQDPFQGRDFILLRSSPAVIIPVFFGTLVSFWQHAAGSV